MSYATSTYPGSSLASASSTAAQHRRPFARSLSLAPRHQDDGFDGIDSAQGSGFLSYGMSASGMDVISEDAGLFSDVNGDPEVASARISVGSSADDLRTSVSPANSGPPSEVPVRETSEQLTQTECTAVDIDDWQESNRIAACRLLEASEQLRELQGAASDHSQQLSTAQSGTHCSCHLFHCACSLTVTGVDCQLKSGSETHFVT